MYCYDKIVKGHSEKVFTSGVSLCRLIQDTSAFANPRKTQELGGVSGDEGAWI